MNDRSVKRAARLVLLRDALQREPHTVRQLAALADVEQRTIYKDLIDLQLPPLSVPLQVDERGRWYVLEFCLEGDKTRDRGPK
ncbi:MAG: hypothetical protein GX601_06790 [Anaerolineales bacterium]|nr:hypothetical protein [Anaerolineales bacterium]